MRYRSLFVLVLALVGSAAFGQQQFAKTGVVNIPLINQAYRNAVTKHFEDLKASAQRDLDKMREDIRLVTEARAEASKKGDAAKVAVLDKDIQTQRDAFAEFGRKKQEELNAAAEALKSDALLQRLLPQDIEQAAISRGFALVLNSSNPSVLWYGPDADITAEVIERLAAETQLPIEMPKN